MYRIMLVVKGSNIETEVLYKFLSTIDPDGRTVPYEANTLEELDARVERMLNGDYKKKDILIVQTKGFEIDANLDKVGSIEGTDTDINEETDTQ